MSNANSNSRHLRRKYKDLRTPILVTAGSQRALQVPVFGLGGIELEPGNVPINFIPN